MSIDIKLLKEKIASIIRESQNLTFLTEYDVKIDKMEEENDLIIVEGTYTYRSLLGTVIESGTFVITFDKQFNPRKIAIKKSTISSRLLR